jgi:PhnB protein
VVKSARTSVTSLEDFPYVGKAVAIVAGWCRRQSRDRYNQERSIAMVQAIPAGYTGVTAYLIIRNATRALEFYKAAFGATEVLRLAGPNGSIAHAEIRIGEGHVMLADEQVDRGLRGPESLGGSPVSLMFYVEDVDACVARALAAGATVKYPVKDQFYGDRSGTIGDPFGYMWTIATHTEDVASDEMERRMTAMTAAGETA